MGTVSQWWGRGYYEERQQTAQATVAVMESGVGMNSAHATIVRKKGAFRQKISQDALHFKDTLEQMDFQERRRMGGEASSPRC